MITFRILKNGVIPGSRRASLTPSPLRTLHDSFPSQGLIPSKASLCVKETHREETYGDVSTRGLAPTFKKNFVTIGLVWGNLGENVR